MVATKVGRWVWHLAFRPRASLNREVKRFASTIQDARILELGSGRPVNGNYPYSAARFFDPSNEVMLSDMNPEYGHGVVDCTTMTFDSDFDVVLCLNVLEHVFDFAVAVERIRCALRPGGTALFSTPMTFPLHDEPNDFWRFTEHGFRRLLSDFAEVQINYRGPRRIPFEYYVKAIR